MATPSIRIEQTTLSPGSAGSSRDDGVISQLVSLFDDANGAGSYSWELTPPPGSSSVLADANTATPTFTPDIPGTYLVYCTFNGEQSWTDGTDTVLGLRQSAQGGFGVRMPFGTRSIGTGETLQFSAAEGWAEENHALWTEIDRLRGSLDAAQGSVFFGDSAGDLGVLAPGTAGYVLQSGGAGADPSWVDPNTFSPTVTLDGAYDGGGAGAGRTITADAGAVVINNAVADATSALELNRTVGTGPALSVLAGQVLVADGSAGSPSYAFSANQGTGMWWNASQSRLEFSVGGAAQFGSTTGSLFTLNSGTVSIPGFYMGDTNSGLYRPGSSILAVATGAAEAVRWTAQQTLVPNGSASAPSYSFTGSNTTGMYLLSTHLRFAAGSTESLRLTGSTVFLGSGMPLGNLVDTNTQITWPGADVLTIETGGVEAVRWDASQDQRNAGDIYLGANQSIWLDADFDSRIVSTSDDVIRIYAGGSQKFVLTNTTLSLENMTGGVFTTRNTVSELEIAGFTLRNQDAAALGAQQWSPIMQLEGRGWETAVGSSQNVLFGLQLETIEGTTNPSGDLVFKTNINAAGWNSAFRFTSGQSFYLREKAAADIDIADWGQLWVRSDTPNVLMFTDDAGTDWVLNAAGGASTLDDAYDGGGSGAGRTITADSGPVVINNDVADNGTALQITRNNAVSVGSAVRVSGNKVWVAYVGSASSPSLAIGSDNIGLYRPASGQLGLTVNSTVMSTWNTWGQAMTQIRNISAAGAPDPVLRATTEDHVNLANSEHPFTVFDFSAAVEFEGDGSTGVVIPALRIFQILAPTVTSEAVSSNPESFTDTFVATDVATLYVDQAPIDSTRTAFTNRWALWLDSDNLRLDGTAFLEERASAEADIDGFGQIWVRNDTPNVLVFTDDAGTDWVLNTSGGGANTLDQAYDEGGAGAGASITADSGAVTITNLVADATDALDLNRQNGTGAALRISAGQAHIPGGSAAAPTIAHVSNTDTGFYFENTIQPAIAINGSIRWSAAAFQWLAAGSGAINLPMLAYSGDGDTGPYNAGTNTWAITTGGTQAVRWDGNQDQYNAGDIILGTGQQLNLDGGSTYWAATSTNVVQYRVANSIKVSSQTGIWTFGNLASGVVVDWLGLGETENRQFLVRNPTAAAAGAQQWSPHIEWEGQGWKTDATAESQEVLFAAQLETIQGTSAPSGEWVLKQNINAAGWVDLLRVNSNGQIFATASGFSSQPTWSFEVDPDTGWYVATAGTLRASVGSTNILALTSSEMTVNGDITASGGDLDADGGFRRAITCALNEPSISTTYYMPLGSGNHSGFTGADVSGVFAGNLYVPARAGSVVELSVWCFGDVSTGQIDFHLEKSTDGGDTWADFWGTAASPILSLDNSSNPENNVASIAKDTNTFNGGDTLRLVAITDGAFSSGRVVCASLVLEC